MRAATSAASSTRSPRASTIPATGPWTPAAVSQFEQHIRAICGWPLGDPRRHSDVVMTNLLGDEVNRWQELAAEPDAASTSMARRKRDRAGKWAISTA